MMKFQKEKVKLLAIQKLLLLQIKNVKSFERNPTHLIASKCTGYSDTKSVNIVTQRKNPKKVGRGGVIQLVIVQFPEC